MIVSLLSHKISLKANKLHQAVEAEAEADHLSL